MPSKQILAFTLIVSSAVALSACKRHDQPAVAGNPALAGTVAPAPALSPAAPSVAAAPAPAASQDAPATPGSASFDISRVAMTKAALPPFPYLGWPEKLPEDGRHIPKSQEFDRAYFIVGKEVRPVEGHVEQRYFRNDDAKLSKLGAERNYESVLTALGAVQVNTVERDSAEIDKRGISGSLYDELYALPGSYRAYLIRTPEKNIWLSVSVTEGHTQLMAVDEQPMKQSVRLTSAAPRSQ